jgi:hypothetical protein
MNTQEMIAIKAQYQNEIRRFALPAKPTYATLETSITTLFSLSGPVIKFADDEGDLCTISTQQELDCALELSQGKVLRLHLFSPIVEVPQIPTQSVPTMPMTPINDHSNKKAFWLEKMETKKAALVAKRDQISSKLADESLPAERRRILTSKLEQIQERIKFLETKQQQISQNPQEGCPWKGGRGGMMRGGCGRGQQQQAAEHPTCGEQKNFWLEKMEHKNACLVAKRDQINAKLADESLPAQRRQFLTSKLEKVQERIAFFEQKKQAHSQNPQEHCPWKGGRGGMRGGRGQRECGEQDQHSGQKPCWAEWMDKRQSNLMVKKESINSKLANAEITPERRNVLIGKLEKIEEKIKAIEVRKEMLKNHQQEPGCRRGGRGAGRGGHPGCGRGGKHFEVDQTPK